MCGYELADVALYNEVCSNGITSYCSNSAFQLSDHKLGQENEHTLNVPASSSFKDSTQALFSNIYSPIPADGVLKYAIQIQKSTINHRLDNEIIDDNAHIIDLMRRYLNMRDASVHIQDRKEVENRLLFDLSITIPSTSTIKDVINVNLLLSQLLLENVYQDQSYGYDIVGSHPIDEENNTTGVLNTVVKSDGTVEKHSSKSPLYIILGGVIGCVIGALNVLLIAYYKRPFFTHPTIE